MIEGHQLSKKDPGLQFPEPYKVAVHGYKVHFSQGATGSTFTTPLKHSAVYRDALQRGRGERAAAVSPSEQTPARSKYVQVLLLPGKGGCSPLAVGIYIY